VLDVSLLLSGFFPKQRVDQVICDGVSHRRCVGTEPITTIGTTIPTMIILDCIKLYVLFWPGAWAWRWRRGDHVGTDIDIVIGILISKRLGIHGNRVLDVSLLLSGFFPKQRVNQVICDCVSHRRWLIGTEPITTIGTAIPTITILDCIPLYVLLWPGAWEWRWRREYYIGTDIVGTTIVVGTAVTFVGTASIFVGTTVIFVSTSRICIATPTLILIRVVCLNVLQCLGPFPCNLNGLEPKDIGGIQYLLSLNNMFKK
jgi:hypothetical protein